MLFRQWVRARHIANDRITTSRLQSIYCIAMAQSDKFVFFVIVCLLAQYSFASAFVIPVYPVASQFPLLDILRLAYLPRHCATVGEKCNQSTACCPGLRCLFYLSQCVTSDPINAANVVTTG
ncbi:uncharacterized protein LOC124373467 [Homalodisca vitripennis]|uniref:uncharacterized protein LOC124373467 n=1 Tax=Homalodisca vitripennis TaxID=197043 RepID=UPI001EEB298B|nr:uncharacterized protein LOC124373467 [Homalodisca vitripennis]